MWLDETLVLMSPLGGSENIFRMVFLFNIIFQGGGWIEETLVSDAIDTVDS